MPVPDFTYRKLDENAVWKNEYYNTLIDDLTAVFVSIDGSMMEAPLSLNQALAGNGMKTGTRSRPFLEMRGSLWS